MKGKFLEKVSKIKMFTGMKVEVYKPEIFLGIGLGLIGVGIVEACKSTFEAEEVIEPAIEDIYDIKEDFKAEAITGDEYVKDLSTAYFRTFRGILKVYLKAGILIAGGTGCILYSHGIIRDDNLKLIAAYKLLDDGFTEYRKNVRADLGEEADNRYLHGLHKEKQIDLMKIGEDGEIVKEKVKNAEVLNEYRTYSPYSRFFDETSDAWSPSAEYNKTYILTQEKNANDKLRIRGWITLAEVYEMLGFDATEASLAVGWVLGNGEDKVKFNIFDVNSEATRRFVNGYEPSILLDFNVDGIILDKLRNIGLAQI